MEIQNLLTDDDAVSPVIGVILMVAITVILAAVIATFVLGLGEQVSNTTPNANFQFDYDESATDGDTVDSWGQDSDDINNDDEFGLLTVTHTSGPTVQASELGTTGSSYEPDDGTYTDWSTGENINEEINAGDGVSLWVAVDDSISVTWEEEGDSAILSSFDAPDA